jgi:ABC-type transport system involved in multi-copper enzyme maturation permease subunit
MSSKQSPSTLVTYTRFQFATNWKTTLFWAIGVTIYCGLIVAIYPSVKEAIDISLVPENLRAAFNINDFTQLASFLSSELFGVILPILLPFYGIIALSWVVAGAEERGRLDVLLGNPIPRWNLIVGSAFMIATVFLMFLANVISKLAPDLSGFRYISAYHYYGNAIIEGIWWPGVTVLLVSAILLISLAVVMFNRRDIYA